MSVQRIKCLVSVGLFIIALTGGLAPVKMRQLMNGNSRALVTAFVGGVLLAASLVHMLPDASEKLTDIGKSLTEWFRPDHDDTFPIAPLVVGTTLLTLALVEVLVSQLLNEQHDRREWPDQVAEPLTGKRTSCDKNTDSKHPCSLKRRDSKSAMAETTSGSSASAIALLVALLIHSTLEGISIGAQTVPAELTVIVAAVIAHKGMAAFALGDQLCRFCTTRLLIGSIVLFSLCSPVGIMLGSCAIHSVGATGTGFILAVASGTFLYVSVAEMLVPSWEDGRRDANRVMVVLLAFIGFLGMSFLVFWT